MSAPRRPSPALLVAFVALVVALSGSALAGPVADVARLITGGDVKDESLTGKDVKGLTLKDFSRKARRGICTKGAAACKGAKGDTGPAGAAGSAGTPGAAIVSRLRSTNVTLPALSTDVPISVTPSSWSQAAAEGQLVMGVADVVSVSGCDAGTPKWVVVTTQIDGLTAAGSPGLFASGRKPLRFSAGADAAHVAPLFEPGTATTHTLAVTATSTCTGPVTLRLSVDVVSLR